VKPCKGGVKEDGNSREWCMVPVYHEARVDVSDGS
jgi:hypothetical protein